MTISRRTYAPLRRLRSEVGSLRVVLKISYKLALPYARLINAIDSHKPEFWLVSEGEQPLGSN